MARHDDVRPVGWLADQSASASLEDRVSAFYVETRSDVYAFLLLRGAPPAAAQDLTQEVFLRFYEVQLNGGTIRNHRAWVFTVARNLAENWRAAEGGGRHVEFDPEIAVADLDWGPEAALIGSERLRRLGQALSALSPQQRQCLHLRAEGFRYREIGEILGLATSTVSEFLRRAIARLRKADGE